MTNDSTPPNPDWLVELDHTADAGIAVLAADLPELFARAAWGMFSLITDLAAVRPLHTTRLVITASDRQALLARWLSELNFRHVTQRALFCRFAVLELSEERLVADVSGEPCDLARHTVFTEIKAVTFHSLQIKPGPHGWRAEVIFDL